MTICATRYCASVDVELRAVLVVEVADLLIGHRNLRLHLTFHDAIGDELVPERLLHILHGEIRVLSCFQERGVAQVALALAVRRLDFGVGDLDLEHPGTGQQDVPGNELVDEAQLGAELLVGRRRLRVVRGDPAVGLVDLVFADLVVVDHGPDVAACGRFRAPSAPGHRDCRAEPHHD